MNRAISVVMAALLLATPGAAIPAEIWDDDVKSCPPRDHHRSHAFEIPLPALPLHAPEDVVTHIDILWEREERTAILISDVRVMDVDQETGALLLKISDAEAARLRLAAMGGKLLSRPSECHSKGI